jgi:membrane-associated phospholipid phosphatase
MGAAVALLVVMNVLGIPRMLLPLLWTIMAAGALGSARLALGRHTPLELGAGFAGGFALTLFAMFVLK